MNSLRKEWETKLAKTQRAIWERQLLGHLTPNYIRNNYTPINEDIKKSEVKKMNNFLWKPIEVATPVTKLLLSGLIAGVAGVVSCLGSILIGNIKIAPKPEETDIEKDEED